MKSEEKFCYQFDVQQSPFEVCPDFIIYDIINRYHMCHTTRVLITDNLEEEVIKQEIEKAREEGINRFITIGKHTAMEALLRQIPKEPVGNFPISHCPCCSQDIYPQMKYCYDCGQKIDWGKRRYK